MLVYFKVLLLASCKHDQYKQTSFTSDLRAAGKTDRYRGSRGIGGGVLGLSHPIGLMYRLAPTELTMLC